MLLKGMLVGKELAQQQKESSVGGETWTSGKKEHT